MSGTLAGGRKAAKTNKTKYGDNFYARIGQIGGQNGTTGGFASSTELARRAGAIGGARSKRGKNHRYIIIQNAHGKSPDFEIKPKTAQAWRTFFSIKFPNKCPESIFRLSAHNLIIKALQDTFSVKFKEII